MTHEYVIAVNGVVAAQVDGATAVGWAADAVLAVGSDETVGAISRGDSTFIDLVGCAVTAFPADLARAEQLVRSAEAAADVGRTLIETGALDASALLEPGDPADLAFWSREREGWRLAATVREGAFTEGDEHLGPFSEPPRSDTTTPPT